MLVSNSIMGQYHGRVAIEYTPGRPGHIVVHNDHNHPILCKVKVEREHKPNLRVSPTKFPLKVGGRQLVRFTATGVTDPIKVKVFHYLDTIDKYVSSSKYLLTPAAVL